MSQYIEKNNSLDQSDCISANDQQKGDATPVQDLKKMKGNELQQVVFKVKLKKQIKNIANQTSNRRYQLLNQGKQQYLNDKSTDKALLQIVNADQSYVELDYKRENQLVDKFRELLSNKKRIYFFKKFPIFSPSNVIKLIWDIMTNSLSLIVMYFIPISYIYNIPVYNFLKYGLNYIIPIFLVVDFFISCNTSYYEKGRHIFRRQKIFKHFFSNYFFSDILPVVIYFALTFFQNQNSLVRLLAFFFFLKLNSIWRIFRKFEESTSLGRLVINIIQLIQLLTLILIVSHLFASIWLFIGLNGSNYYQNTWILQKQLQNADWKIQYLNSFYYAIVTMNTVGYGDITPTNDIEMIFSVSAIMVCCGIFAYSINQVGSIFDSFFQLETELRKNMNTINSYMRTKKVSQRLQYQIRQYLDFYWREEYCNNFEVQMKIINQLSDGLKETLLMEANKIALIDSPIFRDNFSKNVIAKTVPLIKEIRFNPEEKIFSQDDIDDNNIYFIEQGRVEVQSFYAHPVVKKQKMINCLQKLQKGQSFGEISFFTGRPRKFTIRSLEFSTILSIKRSDFIQLLQEFPDDYEKFCMIKDQISIYQEYRTIGFSCYACGKETHSIGECPIIHFIPKREKIIRDFASGKQHDRQTFQRKNQKQKYEQLKLEEKCKHFSENQVSLLEQYIDENLLDSDVTDSESSQKFELDQESQKNTQCKSNDQFSKSESLSSIANQNNNMEGNDIQTQSLKSKNKADQGKQKLSQEGSQLTQMNTFLQLFPKTPSNNSLTDKILKETNYQDDQNSQQKEFSSQNQNMEQINTKRQSQFKTIHLNQNFLGCNPSNQIDKDKEEIVRNKKKYSHNQDSASYTSEVNQQENKILQGNNNNLLLTQESKCNFTKQNTNSLTNQILMIKRQSQLNTAKNVIHNLNYQRARQSVQLLENTLTNLIQNVKVRHSRHSEKTKSYNEVDGVLIQQFLSQQLKQIKGFQENLFIYIETDTIKEFKVYYPKHNFSQVLEKLKQSQQIQQQRAKDQQSKKFLKKPTNKTNPSKKEELTQNKDLNHKSRVKSNSAQFELPIISNNISKNQNAIQSNKIIRNNINEKEKSEQDQNMTNLSITQNTNQYNFFEETSKDIIQINNLEMQPDKRQKYYDLRE